MAEPPFAGLEVTPEQAAEMVRDGAQLVDVREPYEWEVGRIDGAVHIELERLASRAGELDRDRPIVFQCRLGARSAMAAQAFRASGWEAYSMEGGLQAWHAGGLPIVPEGGHVADH
jgi:rhodanese-related sulfurtransferase